MSETQFERVEWQWAVLITRRYLGANGEVLADEAPDVELLKRHSEQDARAVVEQTVRNMGRHPKAWKITEIKLKRRPVGAWRDVD